jgi:hypothetical protein
MTKKMISTICILAVLNYIGCSSKEIITKNTFIRTYSLSKGDNSKAIYVNTTDDNQYFFEAGHYSLSNDSLNGIGKKVLPNEMKPFNGNIALTNIVSIEEETTNTGNTLLLVLLIATIGAVIVVAISAASVNSSVNSCTDSVNEH